MTRVADFAWGALERSGTSRALRGCLPATLTVLAYHRVCVPDAALDAYAGVVSASPQAFEAQMRYAARDFDPVSTADVLAWLDGGPSLPRRALLVTFDDGYRDNLTNALPILAARGIPATVFVATGCIDTRAPFYWDLVAHCFARTRRSCASLPGLGERRWSDARSRTLAMLEWLEALKRLPDAHRRDAVGAAPENLDVAPDPLAFADLYLDWDDVRTLANAGVEIHAHTVDHPILTRVGPDEARAQVEESRRRIERETGRAAEAFAFPNGGPCDSSPELERMLAIAGIRAAFTMQPGPQLQSRARLRPLGLRRVAVHARDTLPRFSAKLAGFARWTRLA